MVLDSKPEKKSLIQPGITLALCLLLLAGLFTVLHACVHEDGTFGTCHWAQMALRLFSVSMTLCALIALAAPKETRLGLNLSLAVQSVMAFVLPGRVIPLCMMKTMHCLSVMRPGVQVLCAAVLVLSAVQVLRDRRQ